MQTMRAAVADISTGQLTLEDVPVPEPGPDDVLVRVKACDICLSDVHGRKGGGSVRPVVRPQRARPARALGRSEGTPRAAHQAGQHRPAAGRLDVSGSVSEVLPLEQVTRGVERLATKEGNPIRLVVTP